MKIRELITLMRPWQWYKNLVFFIPLVFSLSLFKTEFWPLVIIGFAVLCLVSSVSYILNDIIDREVDRTHPEKKKRPIASRRVSIAEALLLALVLALIALYLSTMTPIMFSLMAALLFISTLLYSLWLKDIPLLDIHVIAANFIIRTIAGVVIINTIISPWLIMVIFLLALFLAIGKRRSEIEKFGHENLKKKVFRLYTRELLNRLTDITATMVLMSYILYTSFVHDLKLMVTIPMATFLVFRYLYFIHSNNEIARKTERVFLDKQMLGAMVAWALVSIILLYNF